MKNIHLPDKNVFEEQSQAFFESKKAKRLQKKYQAKPFEEEYYLLYHLAIGISYFANLLSALTASTWLFSYVFSIVMELSYPFLIACAFTGLTLLSLEALQRFLASKFFKTRFQYDNETTYTANLRVMLASTLVIASISISLSFFGGFDLVQTVTSPPVYQEPVLENEELVRAHYQNMITEADKTATDYYNRRRYKDRIATEDAGQYRTYLDKKLAYQDSLLSAITTVQNRNTKAKEKSEQIFTAAIAKHENKMNSKGIGLGGAAVFFILLFYLSMWFIEYYDYKTVSQYVLPIREAPEMHPTLLGSDKENSESIKAYELSLKDLQGQIDTLRQGYTASISHPSSNNGTKEKSANEATPKLPTDSFSDEQNQTQPINLFKQSAEVFKQPKEKEDRLAYEDLFTIAHKDFKTGNVKHLNLGNIENMIDIYTERLKEAEEGSSEKVIANRKDKLNYWNQKRQDLSDKISFFERNLAVNK